MLNKLALNESIDYLCFVKLIRKSYKLALLPTKEQEILLNKHIGCTRFVGNYFLEQRISQYKKTGKSDNFYLQSLSLTRLKSEKDTIWLNQVNSQALQAALRNVDRAFVNFFEGRAKFPRFKSKRNKNSFTIPQFVTVTNDKVHFPKFKGGIRFKESQEVQGLIKRCTISKSATGKFFVSILCEVEYQPVRPTGKWVGVDLGIKDFMVTSDGIRFDNHRFTKQYERELAKAQKHLSRKVKGSAGWERQRLKLAFIHEKIANARLDLLHKLSTQIINAYDIIAIVRPERERDDG